MLEVMQLKEISTTYRVKNLAMIVLSFLLIECKIIMKRFCA
jgi:hypothetical protein